MNLQEKLVSLLKKENAQDVKNFAKYCFDGQKDSKKTWFNQVTPEQFVDLFLRVKAEGLVFDGKHITWQSRGISYDYVAYKNKMLLVYPESKIDMGVVLEGDDFTIGKADGKVEYSHKIKDAFADPTAKTIVGAYCVIKNKRGEFETVLSKAEITKHMNSAKTKFIWNAWYKEMVLKTVIKKAVKYHFDDTFTSMDEEDNKNIDPSKALEPEKPDTEKVIEHIKGIKTIPTLKKYFMALEELVRNDEKVIKTKNIVYKKLEKAEKKKTAEKLKKTKTNELEKTYIL